MLCLIKDNSNTIELKVHTSCYCVFDLPCVKKTDKNQFQELCTLVEINNCSILNSHKIVVVVTALFY